MKIELMRRSKNVERVPPYDPRTGGKHIVNRLAKKYGMDGKKPVPDNSPVSNFRLKVDNKDMRRRQQLHDYIKKTVKKQNEDF